MRDLLDWLETHVPGGKLQADRDTYLVCSPLREDTTPSFSVSLSKRCFFDHGTSEHGTLTELASLLGCEGPAWEAEEGREGKISPARAKAKKDVSSDAVKLWRSAKPAQADHPYLIRKHVAPHSCREATISGERVLLVPAYSEDGHVVGCERIWSDGRKQHLGTKSGAFFILGVIEAGKPVVVAEGFSTSAAIHEFSGLPTACTFGAANVPVIARRLRERYPDMELVAATDADDAGRKAAAECPVGTLACIPNGAIPHCDWCDVAVELGPEEAKRQFEQKLTAARQNTTSRKQSWNEKAGVLDGTGAKPIKRLFGLFPVGQVTLLAGMSGTGKSLLLQCLAQAGADGSGAFGQAEPVKTLFIEGDGDRNVFAGRAQAFAWEPKSGVQWLFTMEHGDSDFSTQTDEGRKTLDDIIRDVQPNMVVVDSISGVDGVLDELDTQMMKTAFKTYRDLASVHGVALVAVHHLRKRPTQLIDRPVSLHDIAGSAAAQRFCFSIFGMWTETGEGTKQVVTASLKDWSEAPEPFSYTIRTAESGYKELLFKFHGVEVHEEKDSKQGKVIEAIKSFGAEEFSREDVEERSGASGATVRRILGKYADSKDLLRIAHGRETKYKRSPFSRVFCSLSSSTLFFEQKETRGQSRTESILLMGDEQYRSDEQYEQEPESYCSNGMSSIDYSSARADVAFCSKLVHEQHDEQREQEKIPAPEAQPVEEPKVEQTFLPRGASVPLPLVETEETFPDEMSLPHLWQSKHSWIVAVEILGDGSRSFGLSQSQGGKARCWLREPRKVAA